jgi:hypothetical protein
LREELFNAFMKGNVQDIPSNKTGPVTTETISLSKEERKERAVREREQKVKDELSRVEMNIERSRTGINQEEGERDYKCVIQFCTSSWLRVMWGSRINIFFY